MNQEPSLSQSSLAQPRTYMAVLVVLALTHLLNDLIQSLIPAIYPIIKESYALDFVQIGLITLTFQIAGSLLRLPIFWKHRWPRMPRPDGRCWRRYA